MSKNNNDKRDLDKAVKEAIEKHKKRRVSIFIEESVGHALDTVGTEETKKILKSYLDLIDEFYV